MMKLNLILAGLALTATTGCSSSNVGTVSVQATPVQVAQSTRSALPATKLDTMSVEGEKSNITLALYDQQSLPFTTYIPEEKFEDELEVSPQATTATFYFKHEDGTLQRKAYVQFLIPQSQTTVQALKQKMTAPGGIIAQNRWKVTNQDTEIPYSWATERIDFMRQEQPDVLMGTIYLGEQNGKAFAVIEQFPGDYGDGFAPLAGKILSNLQFR